MTRLYLVRHGLAEDVGPDGTDAGRRLTDSGRARMRRAARGLQRLGVTPDAILTSPVTRAIETATIVGEALGRRPERCEPLQTGSTPQSVVRALRDHAHHRRLVLVGHEPTLSELAAVLLTGSAGGMALRMKKGACVALELSALAPPRGGVLRWMLTARQLSAVRG